MTITSEQCRAARALLNLSQPDLAKAAKLGKITILRFERGSHNTYARNVETIRKTLEKAGIIFIDPDANGGLGVRLKK